MSQDKALLPGLTFAELTGFVKDLGEPACGPGSWADWLKKGYGFEEMRNLPQGFVGNCRSRRLPFPPP